MLSSILVLFHCSELCDHRPLVWFGKAKTTLYFVFISLPPFFVCKSGFKARLTFI